MKLSLRTLIFSFFLILSSHALSAQTDSLFVVGPSEVCAGECNIYSVQGPSLGFLEEIGARYEWLLPTGETLVGDTVEICLDFEGLYTIGVLVTAQNGVLFEIPYTVFVNGFGFIIIDSNADQFCLPRDSVPFNSCEQVCQGTTVRYSATSVGGNLFEATWSVNGASSFRQLDDFSIEVEWGDPGRGNVAVEVYNGFCFDFNSICVDILNDPVASFSSIPASSSGAIQVCRGQTIDFINTSQHAVAYEWSFGIGERSEEENPSMTYETPGTYEVQLIAYNGCSCSDTTSVTVVVEDAESPLVDCVATICAGTAVTYTSASMCGTYTWEVSAEGSIIEGGGPGDNFVTVDWLSGPEGTLSLTVEDCPSLAVCLEPTILDIPILSEQGVIEGPEIVCQGATSNYEVPAYDGTEFSWNVSPFGTIISGQGTNQITVEWVNNFIPNQQQFVQVMYENCFLECSGTARLDVEILPEFYVVGPIEVCENGSDSFSSITANTGANVNSNWQIFDRFGMVQWSSSGPMANPSVNWDFGAGIFLLVVSPDASTQVCTPNYRQFITVRAAPEPVQSIDGETQICANTAYTYEAVSTVNGTIFEWEINDGGTMRTQIGNPINVAWGSAPPYELSVRQITTNNLGCASESITATFNPVAPFVITGDADVCQDQTSTFSVANFDQIEYNWMISPASAGTIITPLNSSEVEILWHEAGPATLSLDACGQAVSFNVTVNPKPQPVVDHPLDLCPNETITVQATSAFLSYAWYDEEGTLVSNVATPDIGAGYYQLVVENEFGCVGDTTFFINGFPESNISISTADNVGICAGDPPTTIYAVDAESGYSYQWYYDNNPIGTNTSSISTTDLGSYQVEITDENGCMFRSNTITLFDFCGSIVICNGTTCNLPTACTPGTSVSFEYQNTSECNRTQFTNTSPDFIPGSLRWDFDDPGSGANNTSTLENPEHVYSRAGFYTVVLTGQMETINGSQLCWDAKIDTVELVSDFEADLACAGAPTQFADLSTFLPFTSITSWSWNFGDPGSGADNTSSDINPMHTYANDGTYTVTLTVTSSEGCTSTSTQELTVYPMPMVSFEEPTVNCEATALQFIADVPATVTYLTWDFGDPTSGEANQSELFESYHTFDAPGTYTVTLFAQSIYGCENRFSRTITIEPNGLNGDIALSVPSPICEGETTVLTAPGGGVSWEWSTEETTETIEVGEEGIYSVTITDAEGCLYVPNSVEVMVLPAPEGTIRAQEFNEFNQPSAYFYSNYEACVGTDVFLEILPVVSGPYAFEWSTGDMGSVTEFSADKNNQLPVGTHDVTVLMRDITTGCTNNIGPFEIIIHPLPAQVTIQSDQNGVLCEGSETTLQVTNVEAGVTYTWSNGFVGPALTTSVAGEYFVTATNEFGCIQESNRIEVLDGPDISKIPSGCHTKCRPDMICLPSIPSVVDYQWFFNGVAIPAPEGTVNELIITESGDYTVEMTDVNGCKLESDPLTLELFDGFGTISGSVYVDVNENGIIDGPDTLASGINIFLNDGTSVVDVSTSNPQGAYAFPNILSTDYTLEIDTANLPAGITYDIFQANLSLVGCDVEETQDWLLIPKCIASSVDIDYELCEGETVVYNGITLGTDTSFTQIYTASDGCDSLENVTVQVFPVYTEALELTVCPGETASYAGVDYPAGTQTTIIFTTVNGCDSTIELSVVELETYLEDLELFACEGETVSYNGQDLSIGTQTTFNLTSSAGCDSTIQVTVSAYPSLSFEMAATPSCDSLANGTIQITILTESTPPYQFSLDGLNYQPEAIFENLAAGSYVVWVQDANGCTVTNEIVVPEKERPLFAIEDQIIDCEDLSATLTVELIGGQAESLKYLWEDGSEFSSLTVQEAGTYNVQLSYECGITTTNAIVSNTPIENEEFIFVPNAFSPNEDGINDEFLAFPGNSTRIENFQLMIFDRWGNTVYDTDEFAQGWDGRRKGKLLNTGLFVWQLKTKVEHCGQVFEVEKEGDVLLIR